MKIIFTWLSRLGTLFCHSTLPMKWVGIGLASHQPSSIAQEPRVLPRNPLEPFDQRLRDFGLRIGNTKNLRIATLNVATLREKEEEMVLLMIDRKIDVGCRGEGAAW